jgi:hypothetical protein
MQETLKKLSKLDFLLEKCLILQSPSTPHDQKLLINSFAKIISAENLAEEIVIRLPKMLRKSVEILRKDSEAQLSCKKNEFDKENLRERLLEEEIEEENAGSLREIEQFSEENEEENLDSTEVILQFFLQQF